MKFHKLGQLIHNFVWKRDPGFSSKHSQRMGKWSMFSSMLDDKRFEKLFNGQMPKEKCIRKFLGTE